MDMNEIKQVINNNADELEALQAEKQELEEECKRLKEDNKAVAIIEEVSGETLSLVDSSNARFNEFEICGNCEQETREGYNLVDFENPTSVPSQIQTTFENNILTLDGDGSYDYQCITYNILDIFQNNKGKTITVQVENATSSNSSANRVMQIYYLDANSHYFDILSNSNDRNTVSIPNTDVTSALLRVFTNNGGAKQNIATFTKPMLYIGTANDIKDYEPYGVMPSFNYPSKIKTVGQEIIKGYNELKIPYSDPTKTLNGITFTVNKDGSLKISGTATNTAYFDLFLNTSNMLVNDTTQMYTFTLKKTANNIIMHYYERINDTWINKISTHSKDSTFIPATEATGQIFRIVVNSGNTVNEIVYPMIYKGTAEKHYEQYQEEKQYGASFTVGNKNLIDITKIKSQTINGVEFIVNKDGSINANGTATEVINFVIDKDIVLKPNTYTLSDGTEKSSNSTYFIFCDGPSISTGGFASLEITKETTITTVRIVVRKGQTLNSIVFKPMLRLTSTSSTYTPHEEQTYTIPIQKEFCKIGDYKDRFIKKDGKWYEEHVIKKLILDGTESITVSGQEEGIYQFNINVTDIKKVENASYINVVRSNYFRYIDYWTNSWLVNNVILNSPGQTYNRIRFQTNKFTTIDEIKSKLSELYEAGKPVLIYYILSEPELIPCTEEQTAILNKIEKELHTYEGGTHIFSTDEISPNFNIKYSADTKAYIRNQISAVSSAVLEIGGN